MADLTEQQIYAGVGIGIGLYVLGLATPTLTRWADRRDAKVNGETPEPVVALTPPTAEETRAMEAAFNAITAAGDLEAQREAEEAFLELRETLRAMGRDVSRWSR